MRSCVLLLVTALLAAPPANLPGGRHAAPQAAPQAQAAAPVPVPEPSAKAMQYYYSGNVLWVVSQLVGLAIPALVLLTGLSASMRNLARRIGRLADENLGNPRPGLLYTLWRAATPASASGSTMPTATTPGKAANGSATGGCSRIRANLRCPESCSHRCPFS